MTVHLFSLCDLGIKSEASLPETTNSEGSAQKKFMVGSDDSFPFRSLPIFRCKICEFQGVLFKKMSCFQNESLVLSGGTNKKATDHVPCDRKQIHGQERVCA